MVGWWLNIPLCKLVGSLMEGVEGGRGDKEERLPQTSSFLLQWGFIIDEMVTLGHN
jgi:hypothetical protein